MNKTETYKKNIEGLYRKPYYHWKCTLYPKLFAYYYMRYQFFVLTPQSVIRISPCRTVKRIPNNRFELKESVFTRLRLTLFKYFLVCQEIQESDSQHTEFVLFAMNVITNNDNLTKVVID